MYELLILVASETPSSLEILDEAIVAHYETLGDGPGASTSISDGVLVVSIEGFMFSIHHSCDAAVLEESQDIARLFGAGRDDAETMAGARCRYELSSDPDPDMDRFNDLVFITEAAEKTGQVFAFDPQAQTFY